MTPFILIAALLAVLYLLLFCYRGPSWPKSIVKTLSVLLLAVVVALSGGPFWLIAALTLCAAGDYFLSRGSEATFMAGVGAFAAGHLAYVVAFLTHDAADLSRIADHGVVVTALALFGLIMAGLLFSRAGSLRFAVLGYIPVILSMALAALALPMVGPLALILPAALSFLLSDTVLSLEEFVLPEGHGLHRILPFVVWPTYWLAQIGFFWGLFWGTLG
jgi:uncharacterized membrane protein YhhN